jgi:hypothetical protein
MKAHKNCAYCAERVLAAAIKCKHCGSNLSKAEGPCAQGAANRGILAACVTVAAVLFVGFALEAYLLDEGPPAFRDIYRVTVEDTIESDRRALLQRAIERNDLIEISGTVMAVNNDIQHGSVTLGTDTGSAAAVLELYSKVMQPWINLKQYITLQCNSAEIKTSREKSTAQVVGRDCVVYQNP